LVSEGKVFIYDLEVAIGIKIKISGIEAIKRALDI